MPAPAGRNPFARRGGGVRPAGLGTGAGGKAARAGRAAPFVPPLVPEGAAGRVVMLPWPARELSPNSRAHWRVKHRQQRHYRETALFFGRAARIAAPAAGEPIAVRLVFRPPNRIRRDEDNMMASLKYGLDGIAAALGVDDSRFRPSHEVREPHPGGVVEVWIGEARP